MMVGARFVCARCRLRGWTLTCPRCERERLDLASDAGRADLASVWSVASLWSAGASVHSWRSLRHPRVLVVWLGAALLALGTLGAAIRFSPRSEPLEVLLFAGVVLLGAAPMIAVLAARFVRVRMRVQRLGASAPAGSFWIPSIERDAAFEQPVRGTATLASELVIDAIADPDGWIPREDAWLACDAIELDGERLRLEHGAGTITWGTGALEPEPVAEESAGYREATLTRVPGWAHDPQRPVNARRWLVPPGREVIVRGGRVESGALWGTREHPLHLQVRAAR